MNRIGVQTKGVVDDEIPEKGFQIIRQAGFACADFSLNQYLMNYDIYKLKKNAFFDQSVSELERFFIPHKIASKETGITINQMHMPYPLYIRKAEDLNEYLWKVVAPKSLAICAFLECPYIVVHGFKLSPHWGSEKEEWGLTASFLRSIAPMAKEYGITVCLENIYSNLGGRIIEGNGSNPVKTAERIDRLNEEVGSEVFGFCFDTGHANLLGLDFESFLYRMGHRVKVLHIHDNDGIADLHQIPFTFTRTRENAASTDWDGFIRGLKEINYQGVLSFETSPVLTSFPSFLKYDVLSFIAKIGNYFAEELEKK